MATRRGRRPSSTTRRTVARAAGLGAALAAGAYGYQIARFRALAARPYEIRDPPAPGTDEFALLLEGVARAPIRDGNQVRVLRNGDEIFPAMLDAIASAEQTIDFSTYVWWRGEISPRFAGALAARARDGIEVNVLLDAVGAAQMERPLVDDMRRAGVTVAWARPLRWYSIDKAGNRVHRRILVVDGRVGFTGGVGIAEEWTGNVEDELHWRETHVRLEGPATRDLIGAFVENWTEATGTILTGRHLPEPRSFEDGVRVQVARSQASKGNQGLEEMMWAALAGVRRRYWLTTAYFAPRRAFVDALCAAADRGVDVRILVNGPHIHHELTRQAGHRSYARLMEHGVRVFEYQQTMLHAKVLVVDDGWADLGSSNFDNRSFSLHDEINVAVQDEGVVTELEKHFLEDLDHSEEIDLERWRRRPLRKKAFEVVNEGLRQSL